MRHLTGRRGQPSVSAGDTAWPFVAVLSALSVATPLALNMYLPALPEISAQFGVDVPRIQLSVPLFLLGLGVGQLAAAPVSDRHGRRPTAVTGVAIFGLATIGILLSQTVDRFMAFRLVQGIGAGVATVNIGAVVGDLFNTSGAARMFSLLGAVQAIARLAGPILGVLLVSAMGWHSVFLALLLYCAVLGGVLWLRLPETVSASNRSSRPLLGHALYGYRRVFIRSPALGYACCLCFSTACMYVYLTDAAFIYMEWFGVGPRAFSGLLAMNVIAFALCAIWNVRLLKQHPAHRIVPVGCGVLLLLACALLAHVTLTTPSLSVVAALLLVSMGVLGLIVGNVAACFLAHFPDVRGGASGIVGSLQFLVGGALSAALSIGHTATLATAAAAVTVGALGAVMALAFATPGAHEGASADQGPPLTGA